jgi:hypothetical protein
VATAHRALPIVLAVLGRQGRSSVGSSTLTACACGESTGEKRERAVEPFANYKPSLFLTMSKRDIFDDLDDDVDKDAMRSNVCAE